MNVVRVLIAVCFCLTVAASGRPADPPTVETARARAASRVKDLHPDESFLLALDKFKGERVLIPVRNFDAWEERPLAPAEKLLSRLQNFCETYTPRNRVDTPDMIPFGVRGTWVVAPETQSVINFDYRFVDPLMARNRNTALADAVLGIPLALMPLAGSDQGIAVSALPAAVQSSLLTALHPPLQIETRTRYVGSSPPEPEKPRVILEGLNPSAVQFRMRLRNRVPSLRISTGSAHSTISMPVGVAKRPTLEVDVGADLGEVNLEAIRSMPNKYKPTDLDGSKYTQPLGIHGSQNVSSILERVETMTGLKVHASAQWSGTIIYVGSDAVTCGEALDGLRLIFTGTWRKAGDVYLLCWDREGLRRLQYRWNKAASPVIDALKSKAFSTWDERWLTIAMQVPFASDDPMRWNDEQRQTMLGPLPYDKNRSYLLRQPIFYPAMTPAQQAVVRGMQTVDDTRTPSKAGSEPLVRPLRDDEWARVALSSSVEVETEVKIAGLGWVRMPIANPSGLEVSILDYIRVSRRMVEQTATHPQAQPVYRFQAAPWGYSYGEPVAKDEGVMVRAIPPVGMAVLVKSLKAAGVTTLIYPILYNGYASMPGTPFPVDPALKGANGWVAAVKAGNAAGLRVIGSINVLEWRVTGAAPHWLDARPDLLDVDEFGQTRSQWIAALGAEGLDYRIGSAIGGDPVRVSSPDVISRLTALVDAAARTPGALGILFDRWEQSPDLNRLGLNVIPRMGYGEPDRVASILDQGKDPLDAPAQIVSFQFNPEGVAVVGAPRRVGIPQATRESIGRNRTEAAPSNLSGTPESLLDHLIQRARKAVPTWKTWVVKEGEDTSQRHLSPFDRSALSFGDVTLYTAVGGSFGTTSNWLLRIPSKAAVSKDPKIAPEVKQWRSIAVPLAEQIRPSGPAQATGPNFSMIAYDFRGATEDPVVSLKWLKEQTARAGKARDEFVRNLRENKPAAPLP